MMHIRFLAVLLALAALPAAAQMYRWIDKDGKVHYSDQPPPAAAKKLEEKRFSANVVPSDRLPYATQVAMKNFPVTLFTGDCGAACTEGKAYLVKRGIPFTERLPASNEADREAFAKLSPENLVPLLLVGDTKLTGFYEHQWAAALDAAGYPKSNPLAGPAQSKPTQTPPPAAPAPDAPALPAPKPGY